MQLIPILARDHSRCDCALHDFALFVYVCSFLVYGDACSVYGSDCLVCYDALRIVYSDYRLGVR